jgi:hypothetical protein
MLMMRSRFILCLSLLIGYFIAASALGDDDAGPSGSSGGDPIEWGHEVVTRALEPTRDVENLPTVLKYLVQNQPGWNRDVSPTEFVVLHDRLQLAIGSSAECYRILKAVASGREDLLKLVKGLQKSSKLPNGTTSRAVLENVFGGRWPRSDYENPRPTQLLESKYDLSSPEDLLSLLKRGIRFRLFYFVQEASLRDGALESLFPLLQGTLWDDHWGISSIVQSCVDRCRSTTAACLPK